ncbi:MAG: UpxY family transcription antiterminator [Nitrospiraceae bacterium]|nr:UpxY family transcription antiterminator [Nitrospiraceae bacterium]MDA8089024.1 UpxY family transcription antiterminator [Nitrospiraceae bacterium]
MNWFALYVKSRHEFVTRKEIEKKGIETFLPQVKKLRRWTDRNQFVDFPLFPGYIFVRTFPNPENFVSVLKARGAVSLVSAVAGHPAPVDDEEISSLRIMVGSGEKLDLTPHLSEGERVRIKGGPLKGAQGVLSKKEDQYVFSVNVELLGRSLCARVYSDDVEAL